MCMQEKGGWESREVVDAYADFAETCFRLFGGKVKFWFTFNEPIVPVEGGYLYDFHYPNVVDFRRRHRRLSHHAGARESRTTLPRSATGRSDRHRAKPNAILSALATSG